MSWWINLSFLPSDPSDAFVLDMPGVNIAPYWIQTPPTIVSLTIDQTLVLQAKALGTPAPNFHWYKDHHEELFITENVQLETSEELSQLTITNMQVCLQLCLLVLKNPETKVKPFQISMKCWFIRFELNKIEK